MEILIIIGIIIFLIFIFSGNNSSKTSTTTTKPTSTPKVYDLGRQAQEQQLEEKRKQREELARQQAQRKRAEQERLRQEQHGQQYEPVNIWEIQQLQEQARQNARVAFYKTNWTSFQNVLQENYITRLYHFTDRANLTSIKQHGGLLSWYYCQQNNITIPKPGGSSTSWILDQRKGLQNFVRVSFVRDHPMMFVAQNDGRITCPVVLEINPEVIYLKNTRYSSRNAAKNGVTADTTFEKFNSIKFSVFGQRYFDLSVEDKPFYQAEVLILEKVPLEYIMNINQF